VTEPPHARLSGHARHDLPPNRRPPTGARIAAGRGIDIRAGLSSRWWLTATTSGPMHSIIHTTTAQIIAVVAEENAIRKYSLNRPDVEF
jgi:hypothetical protein